MNNSVLRAIKILECISKEKNGLSITEISKMFDIPKSSVFDIVHTLHNEDFLELTNQNLRTYTLGLRVFQLGSAYMNNMHLSTVARPFLEALRDKSNETVYMATEHKGSIVYLEKLLGNSPISSSCNVGAINDMHTSGLGKALLASYPEEKVRRFVGSGNLKIKTVNTIKTFDALLKELESIRERGYALDRSEDVDYICCVAAPIFDKKGDAIASISISSLSVLWTAEKEKYFSELVVEAAQNISKLFGYSGERLYIKDNI